MAETNSTEQSLQGVNANCNGNLVPGGETESVDNPQQVQLLMEESARNGDARRGQDPGSLSPFRDPCVCKVLICLSFVAGGLFLVVIALVTALSVEPPRAPVTCPDGWVAFQGKCYYFSETEGNWTDSRGHCSALGAALAGIDTQQDLDFMLRYRGLKDHWFGLRKEMDQLWRWVNGTKFNDWFKIGGGGKCAYLKEGEAISSSRCSMERRWICSKPHTCAKV